jgi:predicted nucleotide-binding protein (sugar kinase/HSP70/actin superfamily)
MGSTCLAAKALFEGLKIPFVIPEKNNKLTLQTGSMMSPEDICFPFKVMMGNYIESIGRGADTIVLTGSCGPCRFGEYCEMQMKLLKKVGLNAEMIVIDSPRSIGKAVLWSRIKRIASQSSLKRAGKLNALRKAIKILNLADEINSKARWLAGYEVNRGQCKRLLMECETRAYECSSPAATQEMLESYRGKLDEIEIDTTRDPIKIALIGEIYSMIEPFSNLYIEDRLMDFGVSTTRLITPSWWIKDLVLKPLKLNSLDVRSASKSYLPKNVGGHAKESVAHAIISHSQKADGVIQIFPLGCMPEVVTKSILPVISREKNFPILSMVMDEITGDAGYATRIEAFLDMLEAKRKKGALA